MAKASSHRYHNGERFIGGTAAFLHQIKQDGGLMPHYDNEMTGSAETSRIALSNLPGMPL